MRQPKSEKAKKTLENMKIRRANDSITLRANIEAKLKWAIEEKARGIAVIEKQFAQIKENKDTILKLDGIILVLKELLEPPKEEPKKE